VHILLIVLGFWQQYYEFPVLIFTRQFECAEFRYKLAQRVTSLTNNPPIRASNFSNIQSTCSHSSVKRITI